MARSLVPIIGQESLLNSPDLLERIRYIVETDFGHTLYQLTAGSVHELSHTNPLKTKIPFVIELTDAVQQQLTSDWIQSLCSVFPSLVHLQQRADYLPIILKDRSNELSLAHLNGGSEVLKKAAKKVYQRLDDPSLGVPELAASLATSKSTLERICKKHWTGGVGHLIMSVRMEEAKRMILETDEPINTIALAVGYENLASFDRRFQLCWSMSPTQMRQNANIVRQNAKVRQSAKQKR